ncbi:MAG: hypothetical protein QY325_15405 [Flavobacteriales bacterium]|jgi:hypothetical protein|nr:MAG: hypothetical protein QY325_15405 [Flavobacteriales bacterium]
MHRFLALLLPLLPALLPAQDGPEGFVIEGRFDAFTTDELGYVYALAGDELRLFDPKGRSWLRNSVKTLGRIACIDAFYSLKPMVFAPEQGQLAVLDNTLAVQGSVINLPRSGFPQVVLACMSVQNGFWFFDQREMALVRVDAQLRPLANTGRLDQLLGRTLAPTRMLEHESRLYVLDPQAGIHVFDLFGTFMRTIPVMGAESFSVRGFHLHWFADGMLHEYDMRSFAVRDIPVQGGLEGPVRDARSERGLLYLLTDAGITVRTVPDQR